MSKEILRLTENNFDETVANGTVLVDFWAEWCGPCKMMHPVIDDVKEALGDKIVIGKVNVDECENLSARFGIMSIPTLLIFKDGQQKEKLIGFKQKEVLLGILSKY